MTPRPNPSPNPSLNEDEDVVWMDDQGGRLVRPYSVTRGRTRATRHELDLFAIIRTRPGFAPRQSPDPEYDQILYLCQQPLSVAEVAAYRGLPTSVVKIVVSDLLDRGLVEASRPVQERDLGMLRSVLAGLRAM